VARHDAALGCHRRREGRLHQHPALLDDVKGLSRLALVPQHIARLVALHAGKAGNGGGRCGAVLAQRKG
jgi:hypothetical protein